MSIRKFMALVKDKFMSVVLPHKKIVQKEPVVKKTETEKTREEVDVKMLQKELADTKNMLGKIIGLLQEQKDNSQQTIVYKEVAVGEGEKIVYDSDIFDGVTNEINIDTENIKSNIEVQEEKKDASNVEKGLEALDDVL